jgi:signal peptidase II
MTAPSHTPRAPRAIVIMLVSLALYLFADLASKEWALDNLSTERIAGRTDVCQVDAQGHIQFQRLASAPRTFVEGVLRFTYAENCGASFSMLRSAPGWLRMLLFGAGAVIASIVLVTMFVRGVGSKLFAAAVPLIVSGALGNVSDRLRHGFVIDFIQVDPKLFSYPVFNVADIAIGVGVGLFLLDSFKKPEKVSAQPNTA